MCIRDRVWNVLGVYFGFTKQSQLIFQCNFHTKYGKDIPSRPITDFWHQTLADTGSSVRHPKSAGAANFVCRCGTT